MLSGVTCWFIFTLCHGTTTRPFILWQWMQRSLLGFTTESRPAQTPCTNVCFLHTSVLSIPFGRTTDSQRHVDQASLIVTSLWTAPFVFRPLTFDSLGVKPWDSPHPHPHVHYVPCLTPQLLHSPPSSTWLVCNAVWLYPPELWVLVSFSLLLLMWNTVQSDPLKLFSFPESSG